MRLFHWIAWAGIGAGVLAAGTPRNGFAQVSEVKEFVKDGIRYRETKQTVRRPIYENKIEEQQQTVFQERYDTKWQTSYRTYQAPIVEYRMVPYLANRWNPFAEPYWTYRQAPVTRWETRQQELRTPVMERSWEPRQQTVKVIKPTQRMAEESSTTIVALGPAETSDGWAPAGAESVSKIAGGGKGQNGTGQNPTGQNLTGQKRTSLEGDPPAQTARGGNGRRTGEAESTVR